MRSTTRQQRRDVIAGTTRATIAPNCHYDIAKPVVTATTAAAPGKPMVKDALGKNGGKT